MNIPGYHYDAVKKKYFKVQPNHLAPAGSQYTQEAIEDCQRESKKRKRKHARSKREVAQTVRRSKLSQHTLLGELGLEREFGRVSMSSRMGATRRAEVCAGMFERHTLLDFEKTHEGIGGAISTFARDLKTGILFVGFMTNRDLNLRSYAPSRPTKGLSEYRPEGSDCRIGRGYGWPYTLSISPVGFILATSVSQQGRGELWTISVPSSPTDSRYYIDGTRTHYSMRDQLTTTRSTAALPSANIARFAIGSSKTFTSFTMSGTGWTHETRKIDRAIFAVEWQTPTVALAGLNNGSIVSFDLRSRGWVARARHHPVVRCIRKVDDWRIVVNSGLDHKDSLCMYDIRYAVPKRASHIREPSTPYLRFPEYEGTVHGMMDICPELGLIATASHKKKIQLFSVTTGRSISSPTFTSSYSSDLVDKESNLYSLSSSSRSQESLGTKSSTEKERAPVGKQNTPLPSLTSFTYPDDIKHVCFQTVPPEHDGDGSPSFLVGAGTIVDEWKM